MISFDNFVQVCITYCMYNKQEILKCTNGIDLDDRTRQETPSTPIRAPSHTFMIFGIFLS
jgi:hypothetical protein